MNFLKNIFSKVVDFFASLFSAAKQVDVKQAISSRMPTMPAMPTREGMSEGVRSGLTFAYNHLPTMPSLRNRAATATPATAPQNEERATQDHQEPAQVVNTRSTRAARYTGSYKGM